MVCLYLSHLELTKLLQSVNSHFLSSWKFGVLFLQIFCAFCLLSFWDSNYTHVRHFELVMVREAWCAAVHGTAQSTELRHFDFYHRPYSLFWVISNMLVSPPSKILNPSDSQITCKRDSRCVILLKTTLCILYVNYTS